MINTDAKPLIAAACVFILTACGGGGGGDDPLVIIDPIPILVELGQARTAQGTVQGEFDGELVVFRGIRYAMPPVGDRRFKPPATPGTFTGVVETTSFGENCIQPQGGSTTGSEDCLFMNIWTHRDDGSRPVMVYMHPGAANGVGGSMSSIDGADLAADNDVVVVNFNRRIGPLGYLAIDELIAENPRLTAGNYGLLDVVAAFEWITANIAEFGGDPNRIMLFGTSAGANVTCLLLAAPDMANLVNSVAMQSGASCGTPRTLVLNDMSPFDSTFPSAVESHREFLNLTGCDGAADVLACLRALPAEDLVVAGMDHSNMAGQDLYVPLIDGVIVESDPMLAVAAQTIGDVPLIIGVGDNETADLFPNLNLQDDQAYRDRLAAIFADPIDDQIYDIYPTANYGSPNEAFLAMIQDLVFSCPAERLALNASSGVPAYIYEITRGFDTGGQAGKGAYHAIDIPLMFGTFDVYGVTPDAQSLVISDAMRRAWRSVAADPTGIPVLAEDGSETWPAFDETSLSYTEFGDVITGQTSHRDGRCVQMRAVFEGSP